MRHAAGERAQGLHLLRLADALFELLFRGPVLHDDHHTGSLALIVAQQGDAVAEPDRGAILVRIAPLREVAGDLSSDQAGELMLPLGIGDQSESDGGQLLGAVAGERHSAGLASSRRPSRSTMAMPTAALAKEARKATLFSGDDGKTGIKTGFSLHQLRAAQNCRSCQDHTEIDMNGE